MIRQNAIKALLGTAILALSLGVAACEEEGAGEKAGKKLDKAAEEMKKTLGK